jgi:hypothetical protein
MKAEENTHLSSLDKSHCRGPRITTTAMSEPLFVTIVVYVVITAFGALAFRKAVANNWDVFVDIGLTVALP